MDGLIDSSDSSESEYRQSAVSITTLLTPCCHHHIVNVTSFHCHTLGVMLVTSHVHVTEAAMSCFR